MNIVGYYVKRSADGEWEEVTRAQWIEAERNAGFWPKNGDRNALATGGFGREGPHGEYIAGKLVLADKCKA